MRKGKQVRMTARAAGRYPDLFSFTAKQVRMAARAQGAHPDLFRRMT